MKNWISKILGITDLEKKVTKLYDLQYRRINIGKDGLCKCTCADKCRVDGRTGSSPRCTETEIERADFEAYI